MQNIIQDYPNYIIYSDGRIWSNSSKKFLQPSKNSNDYLQVSLWKNGERKTLLVHRLVALAFIPNPNNLPEVNHKDENKENNDISNLEWVIHKDNINYGTRNKKCQKSQKNTVLMIDKNTTEIIREFDSSYDAAIFLGDKSKSTAIRAVCRNKRKTAYGYKWKYK